jgi:hypothetical protein
MSLKPNNLSPLDIVNVLAAFTRKAPQKIPSSQFELFQRSMKYLLLSGQIIGLNPVIGYAENDLKKIR